MTSMPDVVVVVRVGGRITMVLRRPRLVVVLVLMVLSVATLHAEEYKDVKLTAVSLKTINAHWGRTRWWSQTWGPVHT